MTLPPMGLAQRLMLLGMLAVVLSTTVGGLLLREQLHAVILRSMAGSLGERADRIAAGMRLDRDGTPSLDHRLVNDEFRFRVVLAAGRGRDGAPLPFALGQPAGNPHRPARCRFRRAAAHLRAA